MRTFGDFLNKRDQDTIEHLQILGHILDKAEFKVKPHIDDREPYLFIFKPDLDKMDELQFDGIRIYCRGRDLICYRTQMNHDSEPFGETYSLDINGLYQEYAGDKNAAYLMIHKIIKQLKKFFVDCAEAEVNQQVAKDSRMGNVIIGNTMGTDYSNTVTDVKRA